MRFKHRKYKERVEQAEARNSAWNKLTPEQQLQALEDRGHGHCVQAQELREVIANA